MMRRTDRFFAKSGNGIPKIIGILNLTDDSFSDGGSYRTVENAVAHAEQMLAAGAMAIDIGAESTRPGASAQPEQIEIDRLVPVIRALRERQPDCVICVDTRKAAVAEAVLEAGADVINDVSGLQFDPEMAQVIAKSGAGLVLMHMRGIPETMQNEENLFYQDLIGEINAFFEKQVAFAVNAGIRLDRIALDPGIGFAKTVTANWQLVRDAEQFRKHGLPLYYGISRKSFLGREKKPCERDFATAGVLAYLTEKKVEFVRVHEPGAAEDAMRAFAAAMNGGYVNDRMVC